MCSNPVDAYFMIQQAIATDDPVILFEPKRRYWEKAELDESLTLATPTPLHQARVVREGVDVTVAAYGPMVKTAMEAATAAAGGGQVDRGRRPALAVAARHAHGAGVGGEDRPARGRARGAGVPRHGRGDRCPGHRAVLLLASRRRCCGSAASTRPTRRAASRRTTCPTSTGSSTPSTALSRSRRPRPSMKQFKLPDVGEGLTEAEIVSWKVKPGDTVKVNEIVVEIETAKSLVELPSPFAGVVTELLVAEGTRSTSARRSSPSTTAPAVRRQRQALTNQETTVPRIAESFCRDAKSFVSSLCKNLCISGNKRRTQFLAKGFANVGRFSCYRRT